jgi:hypothetical protein
MEILRFLKYLGINGSLIFEIILKAGPFVWFFIISISNLRMQGGLWLKYISCTLHEKYVYKVDLVLRLNLIKILI